ATRRTTTKYQLLPTAAVARFESQDVRERDSVQMRADLPHRQRSAVDEFVDGLASELPSARELRHGEPRGFDGVAPGRESWRFVRCPGHTRKLLSDLFHHGAAHRRLPPVCT